MQIHNLKSFKYRRAKRVGRGGKRGTYSGRGIKGQKARAGAKFRPAERDILKKIPKLRGYKFKSFRRQAVVVNFDALRKKFKEGDEISPRSLLKAGIIRRVKGVIPPVKILGKGAPGKKLTFKDVIFSRLASSKLKIAPSVC